MKIKNFIKGLSVRPILNTTKGKSVSNWVVNAGMFGGIAACIIGKYFYGVDCMEGL